MYKVAFFTLGCKVNTYETNAVRNMFLKDNFTVVENTEIADVYVINTCSVTNTADSKSKKTINKAISLNNEAVICVMGCFAQVSEDAKKMMGIDIILGNNNKTRCVELVKEKLINKDRMSVEILDLEKNNDYEMLEVTHFDQTRAFVKIQDGCENFCSYCIIPYARGKVKCKDKDSIIEELTKIANNGYLEVVLTGIHTGMYVSGSEYKLSDLIKDIITKIPKIKRLRLSSIEINEIDDDILKLLEESKVLADHFHLPLQSGSNTVLFKMNRKYTKNEFIDKINKIRKIRPEISITTDVITGFPTETPEEHNETVEFIKQVNFSNLHVFSYSKREGTKSASLKEISFIEKKRRSLEILELSKVLSSNYYESFIDKTLDVIIERKSKDGLLMGHASNYLKVKVNGSTDLKGQMIKVKIEKIDKGFAIGTIVN